MHCVVKWHLALCQQGPLRLEVDNDRIVVASKDAPARRQDCCADQGGLLRPQRWDQPLSANERTHSAQPHLCTLFVYGAREQPVNVPHVGTVAALSPPVAGGACTHALMAVDAVLHDPRVARRAALQPTVLALPHVACTPEIDGKRLRLWWWPAQRRISRGGLLILLPLVFRVGGAPERARQLRIERLAPATARALAVGTLPDA